MRKNQSIIVSALLVAGFAFGGGAAISSGAEAGEVSLLTWEGYADPSFINDFEAESGCTLTATYVGSNDDFAPKLAAGGAVYDVVSPAIDTNSILVKLGLVEPIDVSRIERLDEIFPIFRNASGINIDGQLWGVPFTWGSIPFMYRTDKIPEEPTSLAALWDPKYKGKIALWDDKSAVYVAARLVGHTNIFSLTDEQMEDAKQKLLEQKPLVRKYWATAGELVNLYANGEVWISNTWGGYQVNTLQEMGIPVKEFIPKENAEGWIDNWQIVKGAKNIDCAYAWLNFAISPKGQFGVSSVTGYSSANPVAAKELMSPEMLETLHMDDVDYVSRLILWREPDRLAELINIWNAVKAAD